MISNDGISMRESTIHGRGVFATRAFITGETVVSWDLSRTLTAAQFDAMTLEEKEYVALVGEQRVLMQPPAKFVNHSCDPNTKPSGDGRDVAVRDIQPGEEVTSDYSGVGASGKRIPCQCRAKNCAGSFTN